jgi:phosphopantetheine adenylyltransferase
LAPPNEIKQKRENELLRKQLKKAIAQRDTSDEYAASMLDRSNKAVRERDESNYALKVALAEKEKFKRRINAIESLMGREKPKKEVIINSEETISFSIFNNFSDYLFKINNKGD